MKRFLVVISCLLCLLFATVVFAGSHTVKLEGIMPFTISDEFPSTPENKSFKFQPIVAGEIKDLKFMVVAGVSTSDPSYQLVLLFVQAGDKIHVVAVISGQVRNEKPVNIRYFQDYQFFKTGKFSGRLDLTDRFPGPDDIERVASEKKTQI